MKVVAALVPFLGMFVVFVVVLRAIVFGDRRERAAIQRLEAADAARLPAPSAITRAGAEIADTSSENDVRSGTGSGYARHDETP